MPIIKPAHAEITQSTCLKNMRRFPSTLRHLHKAWTSIKASETAIQKPSYTKTKTKPKTLTPAFHIDTPFRTAPRSTHNTSNSFAGKKQMQCVPVTRRAHEHSPIVGVLGPHQSRTHLNKQRRQEHKPAQQRCWRPIYDRHDTSSSDSPCLLLYVTPAPEIVTEQGLDHPQPPSMWNRSTSRPTCYKWVTNTGNPKGRGPGEQNTSAETTQNLSNIKNQTQLLSANDKPTTSKKKKV